MSDSRARARAAVLELLERRHGIGARVERLPAWVELRLDRALDAVAARAGGDAEQGVEILREDAEELGQLAEILRVGETCFYRDPPGWDALRNAVIPELVGREWIRGLSAGCSSGEEAWTLGMLVDESCAGRQTQYRVVGLDRSEVALATAREGVYPAECARHLPGDLAARYLSAGGDTVRVGAVLRDHVSFVGRDVMQGPPPGRYEIIVCKNVLIYFGEAAGKKAVELLMNALADGGVLLVARSEVPRLRAMGLRGDEIAPGVTVFRG